MFLSTIADWCGLGWDGWLARKLGPPLRETEVCERGFEWRREGGRAVFPLGVVQNMPLASSRRSSYRLRRRRN
jgi:hypothetical protein